MVTELPKYRIEDRFLEKFDLLQQAREVGNGSAFDELVKSIEILLKLLPSALKEFQDFKEELDKELDRELNKINYEASLQKDKIDEEAYRQNQSDNIKWEYREIIEEKIMEILYRNDLIGLSKKDGSSDNHVKD